jgi:hypothetical protein
MRSLIRRLSRPAAARTARRPRLGVETLETRLTPAVTNPTGGPVLTAPEVQGVYLGKDWSGDWKQNYLEGFNSYLVNSTYMDMLKNAGYGVGRGSFSTGYIDQSIVLSGVQGNAGAFLKDSQIRIELNNMINNHSLQPIDANRLYVVYVEDNVAVQDDSGIDPKTGRFDTSTLDFAAYHNTYVGPGGAQVRYAVVCYPGGTVKNSSGANVSTPLYEITQAASHEISEAATDPDIGSWYERGPNGAINEIGDIVSGRITQLGWYVVQREADKSDQAMTPAGAHSIDPASFVLTNSGTLLMYKYGVATTVSTGVASVSNQGVDNNGQATVDFITTSGLAFEFHADGGSNYLGGLGLPSFTVTQVAAGQGVSYALSTYSGLLEFNDATGSFTSVPLPPSGSQIISLDAGTDGHGVNTLLAVMYDGTAFVRSDSDGVWHQVPGGSYWKASMGESGTVALLNWSGVAFQWNMASSGVGVLGTSVSQVSTGTDQFGRTVFDFVFTGGAAWSFNPATGWNYLGGNVRSLGKSHAGDLILASLAGGALESWYANPFGAPLRTGDVWVAV